jgi:hypothetical protein
MPLLPDQPPEAVQLLALVADHLTIEVAPLLTLPGFALREIIGVSAAVAATFREKIKAA